MKCVEVDSDVRFIHILSQFYGVGRGIEDVGFEPVRRFESDRDTGVANEAAGGLQTPGRVTQLRICRAGSGKFPPRSISDPGHQFAAEFGEEFGRFLKVLDTSLSYRLIGACHISILVQTRAAYTLKVVLTQRLLHSGLIESINLRRSHIDFYPVKTKRPSFLGYGFRVRVETLRPKK
jgi:hypothetical protein